MQKVDRDTLGTVIVAADLDDSGTILLASESVSSTKNSTKPSDPEIAAFLHKMPLSLAFALAKAGFASRPATEQPYRSHNALAKSPLFIPRSITLPGRLRQFGRNVCLSPGLSGILGNTSGGTGEENPLRNGFRHHCHRLISVNRTSNARLACQSSILADAF